MISVVLEPDGKRPLYEQLYLGIKEEIKSGRLRGGEKLPSKRKMADYLQISLRTVENAYAQLALEGYVAGVEKKAYYVQVVEQAGAKKALKAAWPTRPAATDVPSVWVHDLKTNRINMEDFPFSVWAKLMRQSLRDESSALIEPVHPQGDYALRQEIVNYLRQFRNMEVDAEQVVVGAGTEYLLGLITELLKGRVFALEEPNYHKPALILKSRAVDFHAINIDHEGLCLDKLNRTNASVVLITPSHHFPLGTVMSINRRLQLLQWASQSRERYLIEDDYDSEYRFNLKPVPPLHSLDRYNKVIYMNTFTRTLAPSLRIAYLVLPPALSNIYRQKLMFYACTVSAVEQYTLCKFMKGGYYERHLNRIRNICKTRRDTLLKGLEPLSEALSIHGQEAGLHLLLTSKKDMSDKTMVLRAAKKGIRVYGLSDYYLEPAKRTSTVIAGYGGFNISDLTQAAKLLVEAWRN